MKAWLTYIIFNVLSIVFLLGCFFGTRPFIPWNEDGLDNPIVMVCVLFPIFYSTLVFWQDLFKKK